MLAYLADSLPVHVADEEEDLFPLLARLARPEDDIDYVLELLRLEHADDIEYCRTLSEPLARIAEGARPGDVGRFAHYARGFAMLQRRHLECEDLLVLPLARLRLDEAASAWMGRRMALRRGLVAA